MCEKECCCECGEEFNEEEVSVEEMANIIVNDAIEQISEGECLGCTVASVFEDAYDLGYEAGRKDIAELYRSISEDILDEE